MRKYIVLLFSMFISLITTAQIVNIPDPTLKTVLTTELTFDSNGDNQLDTNIDINADGEIQVSETIGVSNLFLPAPYNVENIEGLEEFLDLTHLFINLSPSDSPFYFNAIPNLQALVMDGDDSIGQGNYNLVFDNMEHLTYLNITYLNMANNLVISNVSNLFDIELWNIESPMVNINNCSQLINLYIECSEISTLALQELPNLVNVLLSGVNFNDFQFSELDNLEYFNISAYTPENPLVTEINFNNLPSLRNLQVINFQSLSSVDISNNIRLENLTLRNNDLLSLDASKNPKLETLNLQNNNLIAVNLKNGENNFFSASSLIFDDNPNLQFICVDESEISLVEEATSNAGYQNVIINESCTTFPGGFDNKLTGTLRLDVNSNGCDSNDPVCSFLGLEVDTSIGLLTFYGDENGDYEIPLPNGDFTITPVIDPDYYSFDPVPISVSFDGSTTEVTQNICLSPLQSNEDLEVVILAVDEARPGFDAEYSILYQNNGNTVIDGTINLTYDDAFVDFVGSSTTPVTHTAGALTYEFSTLQPFESRQIDLSFNLNAPTDTPPLNGGDNLSYDVIIENIDGSVDTNPLDNQMTLSQTVVNSFDPNDKTCLEGDIIDPAMIGEYLHYMIRFENTGNASAINIIIKDEINPDQFDISTLVPYASSHQYTTRIEEDNNLVYFNFENINLDFQDETNDGYVMFKIKSLANLESNDIVENDAEIYFDFNFPIITNNEVSTFTTLSIPEVNGDEHSIVYPVPASTELHINQNHEIKSISIYTLLGQMVSKTYYTNGETSQTVDISKISSGNYVVQLEGINGDLKTVKIVIE